MGDGAVIIRWSDRLRFFSKLPFAIFGVPIKTGVGSEASLPASRLEESGLSWAGFCIPKSYSVSFSSTHPIDASTPDFCELTS
jgi:hypothetical protein